MIEVEQRAFLDEQRYRTIGDELRRLGAADHGKNDTHTIFYVTNEWQLKVQHLVTKKAAKIAWKSGGIDGALARKEVEVSITPEDAGAMNDIISSVAGHAKIYPTEQRRHDYTLEGVAIAVKYSADWGYHIELEKVVEREEDIPPVLDEIASMAQRLNITLLTPDEEKEFVNRALNNKAGG